MSESRTAVISAVTLCLQVVLLILMIILAARHRQAQADVRAARLDRDRLIADVTTLVGDLAAVRQERDALAARPSPICPPVSAPRREDVGHQTPLFDTEAQYLLR